MCVPHPRESSLSYPITWVISPWRGVVLGGRTAREGLAGFGEGDIPRTQGGGNVSRQGLGSRNGSGSWEAGAP